MTLAGDKEAYGELVLRWQGAALAAANSVLRSVYLSEDAVQDAFVAAWLKLNTLSDPSKFGAWVCKAARNRAKNILVRYSGWVDFAAYEKISADRSSSPDAFLKDRGEKEELHNAVRSLPERVRTVIELHYFEGLSVAEIADKMRISVGTVKWHLSDGRKRLRGELMATNEEYTDTLTERVIKKVEELKLWSSKNDKTGFELVYREVLADVEDLPESEKKYRAMADVLLRGFWWLPGKKNDELIERIADAAEKGHNDEATAFFFSKEDAKLSGDAKIEFIRDRQIPRLKDKGLPLSLGSEWLALAYAYFEADNREEGLRALRKAKEILPADSVHYAGLFYAEDVVGLRDTKYKDKDKYKFRVYSLGCELSLKSGCPERTGKQYFSYKSEWVPAVDGWFEFPANASLCDGTYFAENADAGYAKTASDGTVLTLLSKTESVVTPAGVFENCELWETVPACSYRSEIFRAYYKSGVGIVKFSSFINDEAETAVLSSYSVKPGGGLLPLDKDNTWEYTRQSEYPSVCRNIKVKVVFKSRQKATLAVFSETERLYYDESCFADMAYAVRSEYSDHDDRIIDVRDYVRKLTAAAKTKLQKAHAEVASTVMNRLMDENGITENDKYENVWNFFEYHAFSQRNGAVVSQSNRDFAFEWKTCDGSSYCYQVLFNYIYDFLLENFGCVWSDQWVPGFSTVKELYDYNDELVRTVLTCEDAGTVRVACGEFEDCIKVAIDTSGNLLYRDYYAGKKTYIFAKGVGIIRFESRYAENAFCAVYELTEYAGTGDGYFPLEDGLHRHYELINPVRNYVGYTDYTYVKDSYGRTVVFSDKRGSRKKTELPEDYKTKDEEKAEELWNRHNFDEYYRRQGLVNLKIQIHALFEANPVNWFNGHMPAEHARFAMRVMESFGEDGVPEIWYGAYARRSLLAAAALFSIGETESGKQYMETAFTYYEKWNAIPNGTKLPVGSPWLFGGATAEKGSRILTLSDGSKEVLDAPDIFGERPVTEISAALKGWGWFKRVRKELFFAEYVKRAEIINN